MLKIRISDLLAEMKSVSIDPNKEETTTNVNLFGVSYLCFTAERVFNIQEIDDGKATATEVTGKEKQ